MLGGVDVVPLAESLPELYRAVLDRVADLELAGHRLEGTLVRSDAITAYSRGWNGQTARRLGDLADRAERVLAGRDRARVRNEGRLTRLRRGVRVSRRRVVAVAGSPSTAPNREGRTA